MFQSSEIITRTIIISSSLFTYVISELKSIILKLYADEYLKLTQYLHFLVTHLIFDWIKTIFDFNINYGAH